MLALGALAQFAGDMGREIANSDGLHGSIVAGASRAHQNDAWRTLNRFNSTRKFLQNVLCEEVVDFARIPDMSPLVRSR